MAFLKKDEMKTVQTVEIIFANTKGNFQEILNKVSVNLVFLNIEDHLDSLGKSLSFFLDIFIDFKLQLLLQFYPESTAEHYRKCSFFKRKLKKL